MTGHSRRLLFGGAASLLGLPFLESALPRAARAQARAAPVRLFDLYLPNGLDMATFRPATPGADYTLPPMLTSLAAFKSDFSIVTGLENINARPDQSGDHASGTSGFITCAHANKSETQISLGISADQLAAQKIGSLTRLPSLQLGCEGGASSGGCDSGYGCAYPRNVSWADASTPLPKISDGNSHNHDDMPILLAGNGGGALNPGRHISYAADKGVPKEKVSNLLLSTLAAAGVTGVTLGDSTGALTGL